MTGRYGSCEGEAAATRELDRLADRLHGVGHAGPRDLVESQPVPQVVMILQSTDYLRDPVRHAPTVTPPGSWSPSSRNA